SAESSLRPEPDAYVEAVTCFAEQGISCSTDSHSCGPSVYPAAQPPRSRHGCRSSLADLRRQGEGQSRRGDDRRGRFKPGGSSTGWEAGLVGCRDRRNHIEPPMKLGQMRRQLRYTLPGEPTEPSVYPCRICANPAWAEQARITVTADR